MTTIRHHLQPHAAGGRVAQRRAQMTGDVQRNSLPRWGGLMIGFAGTVEFEQLPVFPGQFF
jgi:hypothetical protein